MPWKALDLAGQRFGKLTVLKQLKERSKDKRVIWECVCNCKNKNIKYVTSKDLKQSTVKSCGCLRELPPGKANFNRIFTGYEIDAKRKNRTWELTEKEAMKLFKGNCNYCGNPPNTIRQSKGGPTPFVYNGIDRINNNKGYILDNCVSCCYVCNSAKSNRSKDEFRIWIIKVYNYYIEEKRYIRGKM